MVSHTLHSATKSNYTNIRTLPPLLTNESLNASISFSFFVCTFNNLFHILISPLLPTCVAKLGIGRGHQLGKIRK